MMYSGYAIEVYAFSPISEDTYKFLVQLTTSEFSGFF